MVTTVKVETLKCQLCGHVGTDVHYDNAYVGGQGYTWFTVCGDEKACNQRMGEIVFQEEKRAKLNELNRAITKESRRDEE